MLLPGPEHGCYSLALSLTWQVSKFFMELEASRRPIWAQQLDPSQQNKMKKTLAKYDHNGDNELTIEEFIEWWSAHPGHEHAYGEGGVHTLISADEMSTPRTPATARGGPARSTIDI